MKNWMIWGEPPYFWKHPNSRLAANFFSGSPSTARFLTDRSWRRKRQLGIGEIFATPIFISGQKKTGDTTSPIELFIDILLTCPFQPKLKQLS